MTTYLLTWNPKKWNWKSLDSDIEIVQKKGKKQDTWSVGITKKIIQGDRFFLMKLGEVPRGIIASGWIQSPVHSYRHWSEEGKKSGKQALYVNVDFDTILDTDDVLLIEQLQQGFLAEMHWTPQSSGVRIPESIAVELNRTAKIMQQF